MDDSQICRRRGETQWPSTDQAENINEIIQKRIDRYLSTTIEELGAQTSTALETWISENITEYAGENPVPKDRAELRSWYLFWLALFPGVDVPKHPCE